MKNIFKIGDRAKLNSYARGVSSFNVGNEVTVMAIEGERIRVKRDDRDYTQFFFEDQLDLLQGSLEKTKTVESPKELKARLPRQKFSEASRAVSEVLGVKQQPYKIIPLKFFRLGKYEMPNKGKSVDLSEYFMDEEGSLYSKNNDTYVTKFGKLLEKLSDESKNMSGNTINTLRAKDGTKVTIQRRNLEQLMKLGKFEDVTNLNKAV